MAALVNSFILLYYIFVGLYFSPQDEPKTNLSFVLNLMHPLVPPVLQAQQVPRVHRGPLDQPARPAQLAQSARPVPRARQVLRAHRGQPVPQAPRVLPVLRVRQVQRVPLVHKGQLVPLAQPVRLAPLVLQVPPARPARLVLLACGTACLAAAAAGGAALLWVRL